MKKSEIYKRIQEFKVFELSFKNKTLSNLNYDELKNELKRQRKYWVKKEKDIESENRFSLAIDKVLEKMESLYSELSEDNLINSNTLMIYFSNLDVQSKWFNKYYNYSILRLNFTFFSIDVDFIKRFTDSYLYCLKNYDYETIKNIIGLYNKNIQLSSIIQYNRETSEHKALLVYLSGEMNKLKMPNNQSETTDEIEKCKDYLDILKKDLSKSKYELSSFNNQYHEELDKWMQEKDLWIEEKNKEIVLIKERYENRITELENLYSEKLKLEEPSIYWSNNAKKHRLHFRFYLVLSIVLSVVLLLIGYGLIQRLYDSINNIERINSILSVSFVSAAIISFLFYILRTCIKLMMSSKHLETEYNQKSMFTYFYLSLLNDQKTSKEITDSEKSLIYSNLFSNPDTGLIKGGNDNSELISLIASYFKKT